MEKVLLTCKGICKDFGITKALKNVDFTVTTGKVCGLIGENGSGKSTLAAVISGIYPATAGMMELNGQPWKPKDMMESQRGGISIIVQEAGTIGRLTVAENIFLGQESRFRKGFLLDYKKMNAKAGELMDELGIQGISPQTRMMQLNMQERKLIEIVKAYYYAPQILIVDETTNALSHAERSILFGLIHKLADEGNAVIIISHDIEEVLEHCDTITILKDGELMTTLEQGQANPRQIKELMVGRDVEEGFYRTDMDGYSEEVVLKADNITTLREIMNFSLELHKGEILGIGGLSDCGMHTLGKALYGEEPILLGSVKVGKDDVEIKNAEAAVLSRMAYMSKDRDEESLAMNSPIYENIASTGYQKNKSRSGLISLKKEKQYVDTQVKGLKIRCYSNHQLVSALSGGNKQKVVFGKWIARDFDIIIMDCPTRGVDIGVKYEMYNLMYELKKAGKAILLIGEELPELIGMCDRILIMKQGAVSKEFLRSPDLTEKEIIDYMI